MDIVGSTVPSTEGADARFVWYEWVGLILVAIPVAIVGGTYLKQKYVFRGVPKAIVDLIRGTGDDGDDDDE